MITRLRIALTAEEWELLRQLYEADLRPPEDEVRFLILQEAKRRAHQAGHWPNNRAQEPPRFDGAGMEE